MTNSTPPNPPTPAVDQPEMLLDQALENLRRESESLNAPPHIEKQLMAAFASAHHVALSRKQQDVRRRRVTHFFGQWFAPGVAIAASVGMASWMMVSPLSKAGNEAAADVLANAAEITFADDGSNPFIALQSLERIALEPTPRLIAANVPRTSLAAYGVPINPETAGQAVRTEMLVAANGQPLAMRFLP